MKTLRIVFQFVLTFLLLFIIDFPADAQLATNNEKLHRLAEKYQEQWDSQRGKEFLQLKSIKSGAWGSIYTDPRIELVGIKSSGRPIIFSSHNVDAAVTISTNRTWPTGDAGYRLSGSGTAPGELGLWDGGLPRDTHIEFGGRVTRMDVNVGSVFNQNHATCVAGTMVAVGQNYDARGMSYEAPLEAYNWANDHVEMALAAANGMLVSNHCYGELRGWFRNPEEDEWYWYGDIEVSETEDYLFGFYSAVSETWDEIAYNAPYYTMVKSGGNERLQGPPQGTPHWVMDTNNNWIWSVDTRNPDGYPYGFDSIDERGSAKNSITVCAVDDIPDGYQEVDDVRQIATDFSSCGPTDDGRIKPDIMASGQTLLSTTAFDQYSNPSDNSYTTASGTSMSTPVVVGSINLLIEHYSNLYDGNHPLSSTVKSVIIHTADEAGPHPGPDYVFGWGLMNTRKAVDLVQYSTYDDHIINEAVLNDQDDHYYRFYANGNSAIRVTMAWTDPPGTPVAPSIDDRTPMLVNDLDLRLTRDADLVTFYPWTLDPDNPSGRATPCDQMNDNVVDNIEQIVLPDPDEGFYTLEVSHKNTLVNNLQQYSLIITHTPYSGFQPDFIEHEVASDVEGVSSVYIRDINRDGLKDIISTSIYDDEITYWKATVYPGIWNEITVDNHFDGAFCVAAVDIDGDMDDDIIGSALETGGLAWWENTNNGNDWIYHQIDATTLGVRDFEVADMGNDGDVDIVGVEPIEREITLWENTNDGMTWIGHVIVTDYELPQVIHVTDLNADGYKDIIAASEFSRYLSWWESPGEMLPWTEHVINNDYYGFSISSGDMDNDGDIDVVSSSLDSEELFWWENLGYGLNWSGHLVESDYNGYKVKVVDLDQDGNRDILCSSEEDDLVTWFRNVGNGLNWYRNDLVTGFDGVRGFDVADMDHDTDIDIVAAGFDDEQVCWWEQDGAPGQAGSITVTLEEFSTPVILPPNGGYFRFDFQLMNNTAGLNQGDIWSEYILPNGYTSPPIPLVNELPIPANTVLTFNNLLLEIPTFASAGTYSYVIHGGLYPHSSISSDAIEFTKAGDILGTMNYEDWDTGNLEDVFGDYLIDKDDITVTEIPSEYSISGIYPNPFNPAISISISLPEQSWLELTVTNILGQQVDVLAKGSFDACYHNFTFNGSNLSSGIYFIHANVPGKMKKMRKVVLMK